MPKSTSLLTEFVQIEVVRKVAEAQRLLGEAAAAAQVALHRKSEIGAAVEFRTPVAIREVSADAEGLLN